MIFIFLNLFACHPGHYTDLSFPRNIKSDCNSLTFVGIICPSLCHQSAQGSSMRIRRAGQVKPSRVNATVCTNSFLCDMSLPTLAFRLHDSLKQIPIQFLVDFVITIRVALPSALQRAITRAPYIA